MHTSQPDTMYNNGTWIVYGTGWNGWTTGTTNPWRMYGADSTQSVGTRFFIDGTQLGSPVFNVGPQEGLYGGWGLSGYGAGNEETLDIEVAELVLYNRKLSDSERMQVETYFGKKWDLPGYWGPSDITGLGLWLEADKITDAVDGGPITTWPDASGNSRNAVPVATAPTWRQAKINGKPSVEFLNSRMTIPGWGTALLERASTPCSK